MRRLKSSGERGSPWGTPLLEQNSEDRTSFARTLYFNLLSSWKRDMQREEGKPRSENALNSKNPLQTTAIPFVSLHPFVRTCVVERKFKIETVNENRTCINEMNLTQLPSVRHFHFTKSFRASHTGSMCILQDDEGILKLRTPILDCGVRNKTCPPWLVVLTEKYCIQSD
ncbi:hypothetical protein GQR58_020919 [Nymphon striatum]|nr:hypothetical protein GQR58_020919 [Nymphon striatum]